MSSIILPIWNIHFIKWKIKKSSGIYPDDLETMETANETLQFARIRKKPEDMSGESMSGGPPEVVTPT